MAKINKDVKKFEFSKVGSLLNEITKKVPIFIDTEIKERKYISSGVYLLNAALSGKMLGGGVEFGKITTFAGDPGTGKTFINLSVCACAQKELNMGVIYIDTEYSLNLSELHNYGIDISPDKFQLLRANKVEDVNMLLTQLLDSLKQEKIKNGEIEPFLIVLDSVGQMSSNKEKDDLIGGKSSQDFTRAKSLGALFRSINIDLGYLNIPFCVANHQYTEIGSMFPTQIQKGGKALIYSSSVICSLSKSQLKTGEEDDMDMNSGITVLLKTIKNRSAKPKKIKFDISFTKGMNPYSGLELFCTPENFDKIGIAQGKMEVDKKSGEMKFIPGGNRWYISHLSKSISSKLLHTPEVFTMEVLKKMDPILSEYFRYTSASELEKAEKEFEDMYADIEDKDPDTINAEDLFD